MLVGDDEDVARIARPLVGTDNGRYLFTLANNIRIHRLDIRVFNALHQQAKGTMVIVGCMIVHKVPPPPTVT